MKEKEFIELEHGGGGKKSWELLQEIRKVLDFKGSWKNCEDDAAFFKMPTKGKNIVFTTDAFIVDPIFFPGGDIGKIAMCGTINDLSVMGAKPIGISLSMVIEEGFPKEDFFKILKSIGEISRSAGVPIATGDTKVTEKGKIDKIEITTAGIGILETPISNGGIKEGDLIISSGDLGEHTVALLSERFNYKTKIKTDSKTLNKELAQAGKYLNACKDPTRGGLAANLVEMAEKSKVKVVLEEKSLPYKKQTVAISELLGLDVFSFASEGRFIAAVSPKNSKKVIAILKKFNKEAKVIGKAGKGRGVYVETGWGSLRPIEMPSGKLVPRIC
ncbi:MAG: Hydrogenase expression/formation protein HypE [Candidatus Moranbacteria bacterium GW2011_GWE2_47_10]|nr:MAG: Hydrogenase expression/formation protein HypE [Candidatus Moranbacteria bacterium GW2011_GWE2_47_10]HBP01140.1 hydrogenase expression/formation protein HypE [Candidatus Moranbacteria bacterium]